MPRKTHRIDWYTIFIQLESGMSPKQVAKLNDVSLGYLRNKQTEYRKGWRPVGWAKSPAPVKGEPQVEPARGGGEVIALPTKPAKSKKPATSTAEDRAIKRAQYEAAVNTLDRHKIRVMVHRITDILASGVLCPVCDPTGANPISARDFASYTRALHEHLSGLSSLIGFDEAISGGPVEFDYSSEEGRLEYGAQLATMPGLLAYAGTDALRMALRRAEEMERQEA